MSGKNSPAPDGQSKSPSGVWVNIFKVGTHTSSSGEEVTATHDDLDGLVESYSEIGEDFKPSLRLGSHPEGLAPTVGQIEGVRKNGEFLQGLFDVASPVAMQAIKNKLYRNVSAGLRRGFKHGEKTHKLVLDHVAILGSRIPAIKGLGDLSALFDSQDGDVITVNFSDEKESEMDKELIKENLELQAEVKELTKKLAAGDTNFSEAESGHDKAMADKDAKHAAALKVQNDKLAEFAEAQATTEVNAVLDAAVRGGRLIPARRDTAFKMGMLVRNQANFSEDASDFTEWKKDLDEAKKVFDFKEKAPEGDGDKGQTKSEMEFAEGSNWAKKFGRGSSEDK